ncbi:MAG: ribulose-phosphate 3-epimerase [Candidatus Hydrogenedentes bacterium]|nr:ribulose-phosphate 3-epimerase [Candidatus Hydrogenedentota bacterium]
MRDIHWSASVRNMNLARLNEDLDAVADAGCDALHVDVMDGSFVSDFSLGFEMVEALKAHSTLSCEVHLQIEAPERYIERFVRAGCASITIHAEACVHAHRVLAQIREAGASPGIAINPGTPLTKLDYLLPHADQVLVLARDPDERDRAPESTAFERVKILRENIAYRDQNIRIHVEGGIDAKSAAIFSQLGADTIVLDDAKLFGQGDGGAKLREYMEEADAQRHVV